MRHLRDEEIELFLAARLDPDRQKGVVRHLLAGCGRCSRKLVERAPERLLAQAEEAKRRKSSLPTEREQAIGSAIQQEAQWKPDERKIIRSLGLLDSNPRGYEGLTFSQAQGLHGVSLVEALLTQIWELRFRDPKSMRWLAYTTVKIAQSLKSEDAAPSVLCDLQARAWGELANACRINEDYGEAEAAFGKARDLLRRGSGDLRLLAWMASLEALLRETQRRLAEAEELRIRTYRLYLKLNDRHLAGRALISLGGSMEYIYGRSCEGVQLLRTGLSLIDSGREPQLELIGQHSLMTLLAVSGEYQEAGSLLLKSGLRKSFADLPLNLLKVRWLEGKILAGCESSARAERAFWEVRTHFLDMGREHVAALVGLDLLSSLLRQGKSREIRPVASAVYQTFQDLGIHQHAANARRYLH
jgi:hypothetical protein